MNLESKTSPTMEIEAQQLAGELQANSATAANELRSQLYSGTEPACNVQELANEANRLAGPYSNHLMVRPVADGRLDVEAVPPETQYCPAPAPPYSPETQYCPAPAPPYYPETQYCPAPAPSPYYPAPPYYSAPPYSLMSYMGSGLGNFGVGFPGIRINFPFHGTNWHRW